MTSLLLHTSEPYEISFRIDGLPRMSNTSGRKTHWSVVAKEKNNWYAIIAAVIPPYKRPKNQLKRALITITRASSVCPDPDGLVSGGKWLIDGLRNANILENDRFINIGMPKYNWIKTPANKGFIQVTLKALHDDHNFAEGLSTTASI